MLFLQISGIIAWVVIVGAFLLWLGILFLDAGMGMFDGDPVAKKRVDFWLRRR